MQLYPTALTEKDIISVNIHTEESSIKFKPTYLMIKRHMLTGLLYFCKTNFFNPERYHGSGKYWKRHLQKYGKDQVETLWYCLFLDKDECVKFALMFSKMNNIGNGDITVWANIIPENGINGGAPKGSNKGIRRSAETKVKMGKAARLREAKKKESGYTDSEETRVKKSRASKRTYSQEIKDAGSKRQKKYFETHAGHRTGVKAKVVTCPHCGKEGGKNGMMQWHFDNCKAR
jgi:hypothetical protein